jgi:hypothetical protein
VGIADKMLEMEESLFERVHSSPCIYNEWPACKIALGGRTEQHSSQRKQFEKSQQSCPGKFRNKSQTFKHLHYSAPLLASACRPHVYIFLIRLYVRVHEFKPPIPVVSGLCTSKTAKPLKKSVSFLRSALV